MHVYGPVPSRRLGQSLGVDLIPAKTCNYSCVYCQLGRTLHFTNTRQQFFPRESILEEAVNRIEQVGLQNIDYITLVGEGEPTLSLDLGWMISQLKAHFPLPVAVITNGALLYDPVVRAELTRADVVMPTVDAGSESLFRRINRPHKDISLEKLVEGLAAFRKEYNGQIWVEIMAIQDCNDSRDQILQIKEILQQLNPNRVYINVPIRPPAEPWVKVPRSESLDLYEQLLGESFNIALPEHGQFTFTGQSEEAILGEMIETIKRHPMRETQVVETLTSHGVKKPADLIESALKEGVLIQAEQDGVTFLEWAEYKRGQKKGK